MNQDIKINKPTILLCWGYTRGGWVEPFEKLKEHFNFVYLYYISEPQKDIRFTTSHVIYWGDFDSPMAILERLKPEKVIFMGICSGYSIALNIACRAAGVTTYICQHGIAQNYQVYRKVEKSSKKFRTQIDKNNLQQPRDIKTKGSSVKFITSVLSKITVTEIAKLFLFLLILQREGKFLAARLLRFRSRMPDYYICYSEKNAEIYFTLDKANPDKFFYIGTPEYDKIFTNTSASSPFAFKYYLLIDQPLASNQYFSVGISTGQMNGFYQKLADFCSNKGSKLVVKLHPENYNDTWLVKNPNIVYVKDDKDIVDLIKGAEGCFGTFSTLLIPAIYFKPTIIFRLLGSAIQEHLIRLKVTSGLDFFSFKPEDIDFNRVCKTGSQCPEFIKDYFYKDDGKATERLAEVLAS